MSQQIRDRAGHDLPDPDTRSTLTVLSGAPPEAFVIVPLAGGEEHT